MRRIKVVLVGFTSDEAAATQAEGELVSEVVDPTAYDFVVATSSTLPNDRDAVVAIDRSGQTPTYTVEITGKEQQHPLTMYAMSHVLATLPALTAHSSRT